MERKHRVKIEAISELMPILATKNSSMELLLLQILLGKLSSQNNGTVYHVAYNLQMNSDKDLVFYYNDDESKLTGDYGEDI